MKKYQRGVYEKFEEDVKEFAPKGYLQPLYNLVGKRIRLSSNTSSGLKGAITQLSSISQDYSQQLGYSILVLRFETGSNVNIPLPTSVIQMSSDRVLLDFKRTSPFDDTANPYRKMRRNLKGYALEDHGNEPQVVIEILHE